MQKQSNSNIGELARQLAAIELPPASQQALGRARARAVYSLDKRSRRTSLVPAITFAASITVVVALLFHGRGIGLPDVSTDPSAIPYVFAGEDAELIEQMEFYRWLDAAGYAG